MMSFPGPYSKILLLIICGLAIAGCTSSETPVLMNVPMDGERVAYLQEKCSSENHCESFVHIGRADGTGEAILTYRAVDDHFAPQWSPDGKELAFNTLTPGGSCPTGEILVIHADSSGQKKIATGVNPVWSPDGTRIAFADRPCSPDTMKPGIYIVNANGTETRRVGDGNAELHWSPDGTRLFWMDDASAHAPRAFVLDVRDSSKLPVPVEAGLSGYSAAWSPDGKKIYMEGAAQGAYFRTTVIDLATGERSDFVIQGLPHWSPDGTRFVAETEHGIVLANADGSGAHTIAHGYALTWSPDGTRVAYMDPDIKYRTDILVVDVNGGKATDIGKGYYPAWSPQ